MKKHIKVLSLFDGISVAQQALRKLGYTPKYMASEIDHYASAVTRANFPNTLHLGDITTMSFDYSDYGEDAAKLVKLDLLIGGSPCQDLSIAKQGRKGLDGERSGLFWEYVRVLNQLKPRYFVLENVASMPEKDKNIISEALGVQPVMINAALVSAQNRKRLFWVGKKTKTGYKQILIPQPKDRKILLQDVLLDGSTDDLKSLCVTATYHKKNEQDYLNKSQGQMVRVGAIGKGGQGDRIYSPEGKSVALSANGGGRGAKTGLYAVPVAMRNRGKGKQPEYNKTGKANAMTSVQTDSMVEIKKQIRKLHPVECLRLQSLPDKYFDKATYQGKPISNTQKYKMCGNAFNCEVVKHILKNLLK